VLNKQSVARPARLTRFTVIRGARQGVSPVLMNLLYDTGAPALAFLAERYGLQRIPGLTSNQAIISRILKYLGPQQLERLKDDLIASRFGALSVEGLVKLAVVRDRQQTGRAAPRLDQVSREGARLVEGSTQRWIYTLRGHDVVVDTAQRLLACDCRYFQFAAHRQGLCKHLATVFQLIPEVYAREALIDLLVSRQYGGPDTPRWRFIPIHKSN